MDEENVLESTESVKDDSSSGSNYDEVITLLQSIDSKLTVEENTEESTTEEPTTEEPTTEETTTEIGIVFEDETADTHAYLSTQVENATMNDLYTVGLSMRNILLLFFLVWVGMKVFSLLKSVVYRIFNR